MFLGVSRQVNIAGTHPQWRSLQAGSCARCCHSGPGSWMCWFICSAVLFQATCSSLAGWLFCAGSRFLCHSSQGCSSHAVWDAAYLQCSENRETTPGSASRSFFAGQAGAMWVMGEFPGAGPWGRGVNSSARSPWLSFPFALSYFGCSFELCSLPGVAAGAAQE